MACSTIRTFKALSQEIADLKSGAADDSAATHDGESEAAGSRLACRADA
jgi:hypothetical protein